MEPNPPSMQDLTIRARQLQAEAMADYMTRIGRWIAGLAARVVGSRQQHRLDKALQATKPDIAQRAGGRLNNDHELPPADNRNESRRAA